MSRDNLTSDSMDGLNYDNVCESAERFLGKLRFDSRMWSSKIFGPEVVESTAREIGGLPLLAFKASCAVHLLGPFNPFTKKVVENLCSRRDLEELIISHQEVTFVTRKRDFSSGKRYKSSNGRPIKILPE